MNRFTLLFLSMGATLMAAPKLLLTLMAPEPQPSAAVTLPFETLVLNFNSVALTAAPWLAGFCMLAGVLTFVFSELSLGSYEPLTEGMRSVRGLAAVRAMLRRVREWLRQQQLPTVIGPVAESIGALCMDIDRQLESRDPAGVATVVSALDKLLTVELATLVLRYQRVPRAQRLLPYLNASANDLLLSGLRAVDDQLRAVHDEMARSDLHELHVQTRYLELTSENTSCSNVFTSAVSGNFNADGPNETPGPKSNHAAASASTRLAPATVQAHQHRRSAPENESTALSLLETVGIAAVTTAVVESLLDEANEERNEERYQGGGGKFGGAGASGDWSDETKPNCDDESDDADSTECSAESMDENAS